MSYGRCQLCGKQSTENHMMPRACEREDCPQSTRHFAELFGDNPHSSPYPSCDVACEHSNIMTETFIYHDWCADCGAIRTKSETLGTYGDWHLPTRKINDKDRMYTKADVEVLLEIERQAILRKHLTQEGYVSVPREPTEEMIAAGVSEVPNWFGASRHVMSYVQEGVIAIYKAMLAAAPEKNK